MRRGFTLIELLLVIAIIGLLSSVIISNLKIARDRAITIKAVSELDEAAKALALYYDKYGEYPDVASYGEKNGSYGCEWDTSDHDGGGVSGVYFIDPVVSEGFISNEIMTEIGEYPRYLYADNADNFGGCDCLNPGYDGYAVIVVNGLPTSIAGVTDNDACDQGIIWDNVTCSGEAQSTVYCKLLAP